MQWLEALSELPVVYDLLLLAAPRPDFVAVHLGTPDAEVAQYFKGILPGVNIPERVGTEEWVYVSAPNKYLVTTYKGFVHGFNIDGPVSQWRFQRTKNVFSTLKQHRQGSEWVFFNNEGFGQSWRRKSDGAWAHYSSTFGIISFHTQEFFSLPKNPVLIAPMGSLRPDVST